MAIPTGHIITVGGLHLVERLQDVGLRDPKIPVDTVRETGNDLVVGKVATEANFQFTMQSWDVSCDVMALLTGKKGGLEPNEGPSAGDVAGTVYRWEECQFLNLACPWARDTGSAGGHITSGVVIPSYYPSAVAYKFGVTANAEMNVTLEGGSYYMADEFTPVAEKATYGAYPMENYATGNGATTTFESSEEARVHRIGGFGGTETRHVFGVLVNGVIQQEGVDYTEEGGITLKEAEEGLPGKKVKIKFTVPPPEAAVIRFCFISSKTGHTIAQAKHAGTSVKPAAVRGRNIQVLIGTAEEEEGKKLANEQLLRGVQTIDLNASHAGSVQREMGTYDPIGYNETGIDANGTLTLDPKEESALYAALSKMTGLGRQEVLGYINEHAIPMWIKIFNPAKPSEIIKSVRIGDCRFQMPGTAAKVNSTLSLPISFESEQGTFREVKGQ